MIPYHRDCGCRYTFREISCAPPKNDGCNKKHDCPNRPPCCDNMFNCIPNCNPKKCFKKPNFPCHHNVCNNNCKNICGNDLNMFIWGLLLGSTCFQDFPTQEEDY